MGIIESLSRKDDWIWHDPIGYWMVAAVRSEELSEILSSVFPLRYVEYLHDLSSALWPGVFIHPGAQEPELVDLQQIKIAVEEVQQRYWRLADAASQKSSDLGAI